MTKPSETRVMQMQDETEASAGDHSDPIAHRSGSEPSAGVGSVEPAPDVPRRRRIPMLTLFTLAALIASGSSEPPPPPPPPWPRRPR